MEPDRTYLDRAAALLAEANAELARTTGFLASTAKDATRIEAARLRLQFVDRYIQMAAIEKGLQPPSLPCRHLAEEPR